MDTPAVATHLLSNPDEYLTPIGPFLRKSSLDELPQLWRIMGWTDLKSVPQATIIKVDFKIIGVYTKNIYDM